MTRIRGIAGAEGDVGTLKLMTVAEGDVGENASLDRNGYASLMSW